MRVVAGSLPGVGVALLARRSHPRRPSAPRRRGSAASAGADTSPPSGRGREGSSRMWQAADSDEALQLRIAAAVGSAQGEFRMAEAPQAPPPLALQAEAETRWAPTSSAASPAAPVSPRTRRWEEETQESPRGRQSLLSASLVALLLLLPATAFTASCAAAAGARGAAGLRAVALVLTGASGLATCLAGGTAACCGASRPHACIHTGGMRNRHSRRPTTCRRCVAAGSSVGGRRACPCTRPACTRAPTRRRPTPARQRCPPPGPLAGRPGWPVAGGGHPACGSSLAGRPAARGGHSPCRRAGRLRLCGAGDRRIRRRRSAAFPRGGCRTQRVPGPCSAGGGAGPAADVEPAAWEPG